MSNETHYVDDQLRTALAAQHTPTPWQLFDTDSRYILDANRCTVAECGGADNSEHAITNAAHIVACVNSHDALVAACERINTWLMAPATDRATIEEMQQVVRAALALAKGESR